MMKFNKLAASTIVSIVLFGSVGELTINAQPAQAIKTSQTTLAAKPNSLIASGNFVKVEKTTRGKAKIVRINGKRYLKFDKNFKTGSGPDVKVILHKNSSVPLNLRKGSYITLSPIQKFKGEQTYLIPENVNLNNYKSIAIWCRKFNATFGYASF